MTITELFHSSPRCSLKWNSYFQVYEELLQRFAGKKVTMVEIGILDGGSLFMWRQFLGPQARIIGIDVNPQCRELEKDGFEVFIGDQSSADFWKGFYAKIGKIDVLIDDGGHTNRNQLATLFASLDHVRDGGLILVEDVHSSYRPFFGNPSRYSFINRCKQAIDEINARNPHVDRRRSALTAAVYSISFYTSMVAFQVNRPLCVFNAEAVNEGFSMHVADQQHVINKTFASKVARGLARLPRLKPFGRWVYYRWDNSRLGCFFR
jgi:hypothetical protein